MRKADERRGTSRMGLLSARRALSHLGSTLDEWRQRRISGPGSETHPDDAERIKAAPECAIARGSERMRNGTITLREDLDRASMFEEIALAERTRIAQELHDTLLQGFAGVALQIKAARLALPEQPDVADETLARAERLAGEALREARESVWRMRSPEPGETDLAAALETTALACTAGTGIEVKVMTQGERRRLPRATEVTAFRIGREAVANAVKHAAARRIEIEVDFGSSVLSLDVRDDGRGFSEEQRELAIRNGHFGLSGMADRARHAGGTCEVRAQPEGGTVVALVLPVKQPTIHHPTDTGAIPPVEYSRPSQQFVTLPP